MIFSPSTEEKIRTRMNVGPDTPIDDGIIARMQYQGMIVTDTGKLNATQQAMACDYLSKEAGTPLTEEDLSLLEEAHVLIRGNEPCHSD